MADITLSGVATELRRGTSALRSDADAAPQHGAARGGTGDTMRRLDGRRGDAVMEAALADKPYEDELP